MEASKASTTVYVYKVGQSVSTLKDIQQVNSELKQFLCLFPKESILLEMLNLYSKPNTLPTSFFRPEHIRSNVKKHKLLLGKIIELEKILIYIKAQKVVLQDGLVKTLKEIATRDRCQLEAGWDSDSDPSNVTYMIKAEILLRSRFDNKVGFNKEQRLKEYNSFLSGVDRQVKDELFWDID